MGSKIPFGMDDEIQIPGTWRGSRDSLSRIVEGDSEEQGDDDLCGVDQPRPCAYADKYTAAVIGIEGGAVFEGEEFAQAVIGV